MKDIRLPEIRFCIIYLTEVLLRFDRHTILYYVHHIHCEPRAYDIIAASHFYPPNIFFPHYNIYRYYIFWNTINGVCKTRDASTLSTVYTRVRYYMYECKRRKRLREHKGNTFYCARIVYDGILYFYPIVRLKRKFYNGRYTLLFPVLPKQM